MHQDWQVFNHNVVQTKQQHGENALSIIGLDQFAYYSVEGDKARDYLQGQLTNDIKSLSPSHWLRAAHCNNKGRILGLYHVYETSTGIILQLPTTIAETAIPALNKFAKFSRIRITKIENLMSVALWGEQAASVLKQGFGALPTDETTCIDIDNAQLCKEPRLKSAYQVISSVENCTTLCQDLSKNNQLSEHALWKHLNMAAGIAELHPETIAKFTPHNLNLPYLNAVNFNKGCYTGQEVIARMEFRGKLKSHLYYAECDNTNNINPGQALQCQERSVGYLIDLNHYAGKRELLILLKDSEIDKPITIAECNNPIRNVRPIIE